MQDLNLTRIVQILDHEGKWYLNLRRVALLISNLATPLLSANPNPTTAPDPSSSDILFLDLEPTCMEMQRLKQLVYMSMWEEHATVWCELNAMPEE